jgi:hypothetical protein
MLNNTLLDAQTTDALTGLFFGRNLNLSEKLHTFGEPGHSLRSHCLIARLN